MNNQWRSQLKNDLEFHSFIVASCMYSDNQKNKSELSTSQQDLLESIHTKQYSQTLCQNIRYDKHALELYLSKFEKHNILSNDTKIRIDFTSRSLLSIALRLYGDTQSPSRIENEVFRFIRGTIKFDSNCVQSFRYATQLVKDLFTNQTDDTLTENEIILQLKTALKPKLVNQTPEIIRAFIEVGFVKRLFSLNQYRNNILTISGEGNFWFLLSSLFGLHADMEGLTFLFYGTLPIYNPPGNNLFIRGGLGCGKSTLASQLAYEVADKGGVSIYLVLEENTAILENLYASFGWTDNKDIIFKKIQFTENDFEGQLSETLSKYNGGHTGLFMLVNISTKDSSDIFDLLDIISSGFLQKIKTTTKLIVLDPINAIKVLQENLPEIQLRQTMVRILDRIQLTGCCSILVGEEHTNENSPFFFEESISDTTIRLFFSEESYKSRILEVCKSRLIPCVRGENRFIIGENGIVVYPSAPSYMAARQGRRYNAVGKKGKMKSGVEGLDEMFGERGIESGTITSFVGEAGTGKMELALCWLSNGVFNTKQACIYVTFSKAPKNAVSLLNNRAKVVSHHIKNTKGGFDQLDELFSVISLRTDGLSSGQIIHAISSELNSRKRLININSARIVIDSLTQLEYSSCSDEDNRSFLSALEETVKTDSISCIICYTRDMYREVPTLVEQKLINISDNHLEFKKVDVSGIQKTIVFTERSRAYNHPHEAMELIIDNNEIIIEPNFSLLADIRKGKTTPITTEIFLHYEGRIHREYNKKVEIFVSGAVGKNVTVHNQLFPQISKNQFFRRGMLEKTMRLVSIDDLDLDSLTEEDYHPIPASLLNVKNDYLGCVHKRIKSNTRKYYRALPLYLNIPVLLCNKKAQLAEPIKDWNSLANWLNQNDNDTNVPAFEFSKGVAENYNCIFLEILHSLVMENSDNPEEENFTVSFYKSLGSDIGKKAVILFWRLCHKAHTLSKPHKSQLFTEGQKTTENHLDALDILQINPSFSFCRTWFTSVYDIFERNPDSYNIKTLPGTGSILGTWYLTIPRGGPAPDVAKKLCVALCHRDKAIERFESWIGIPPYSSLCSNNDNSLKLGSEIEGTPINFARKYLSEVAENAIVRTEIVNYNTISALLSFYLQRILEIKSCSDGEPPEEYIKTELSDAIKAIKKI